MALSAQQNSPESKKVNNPSLEMAFAVHEQLSKVKSQGQQELAHLLTVMHVLEQELELAKAKAPATTKIEGLKAPAATSPIMGLEQSTMPDLSPEIGKDLAEWWKAMERYDLILEQIKHMAKDKNIKNPSYFIMEFMSLNMEKGGAQIGELSAADNMGSDLRDEIGNALSNFNDVAGSNTTPGHGTAKERAEIKKFMDTINQIEAFLKYEGSLSGKGPEGTPIMGKGAIKNLQDAINGIKGAFSEGGEPTWGSPERMVYQMLIAIQQEKAGKFTTLFKNVHNNINTMNQTVSAFSTSTNTELQFQTQKFKQTMGMEEAEIQSYLQETSTDVRNQRSN